MAKPILPEALRETIKELFSKGYKHDAVFKFVEDVARKYVESEQQLNKCLIQLKNRVQNIPENLKEYPTAPDRRTFDFQILQENHGRQGFDRFFFDWLFDRFRDSLDTKDDNVE
jgi:hypothetical protein